MSAVSEKSLVVVGHGATAREWLEAVAELPELALTAGVEPERERRAGLEARGVRAFESVAELVRALGAPDVAILCTPPAPRLEAAEPLLRAGTDLLIEPPLATVPDDADRVAELAERLDRVAMTAARFRGEPALLSATRRIAAGAIGRLCAVEVSLAYKRDAGAGWRGDPALSGGGAWLELGSDALDVAEQLAGPVRRVRMVESAARQGAEVEDEVRVETDHGDGLTASLRVSWNEAPSRPLARCIGDRGELSIGWARTQLAREDGTRELLPGARDAHSAHVAVLRDFLRERRSRERSVDAGAQALAWLHAAYRSCGTGRFELA
ncbi:MAG TPA: Gfo/Idh/MocA family oxidoreductase [Myxococcota bacterium]|nr:Gfo/Idh/MocA family oxidoreductase [Myxococcota bacterium]